MGAPFGNDNASKDHHRDATAAEHTQKAPASTNHGMKFQDNEKFILSTSSDGMRHRYQIKLQNGKLKDTEKVYASAAEAKSGAERALKRLEKKRS